MTPPKRYSDLQAQALDHTKIGGDTQLATALAILTLAAAVREVDQGAIATAIDGLGTSIETAAL